MPERGDNLAEIEARGTVRDVGIIAQQYGTPGDWMDAVRALERVLSRARARDLIWLEANARSVLNSYRFYGCPWQAIDASQVSRLPWPAQRLATFHANGRVREAAVDALASGDDTGALPYLLLRANDWVVQVSDRARGGLEQRLRPGQAAAWITVLPFERHVRALKRRALAYLFDRARGLLMLPDARSAVREALEIGPTDTRRACVMLAAALPSHDRASALLAAVRDRDSIVALTSATALLEGSSEGELREIIGSLVGHRVGKVRARALTSLWARFPSEGFDRTREALFDPALCVREVAQFELRRNREVDPAPLYAAVISGGRGPKLLAALAGLSECGGAQDAILIAPFLRDTSPRVRFEALRGVARLDGDAFAPAFIDALQSASPRVVRVAGEALRRRAHLVDRTRLDALLVHGGSPARAVLTLLPQVDYWGALLASLRAAAVPDLRDVALRVIDRLVGRQTYSLPPDHGSLQRAFAAVRNDLPFQMAATVETLLDLTKPRG